MKDWREERSSARDKLVFFVSDKKDVKFLIGAEGHEEEVKTSGVLLSALSPVFEKLLLLLTGKDEEVICIENIQPKVFRGFLQVCKDMQINQYYKLTINRVILIMNLS